MTLKHAFPYMRYGLSMPFHLLWLSQEQACHAWPFFGQKRARFGTIFCHFLELPRRKRTPTHVFPCMWRSYGPSKRFHLVWLSQEQACHAWLFLGVANELNDPKTCFPIHVIWPINAFPLALVESGASLPCLASFGPKWTIFGPSLVMNGGPQSKRKAHHQVSYV